MCREKLHCLDAAPSFTFHENTRLSRVHATHPELKLTRVQRSSLVIIARARREGTGDEATIKPQDTLIHLWGVHSNPQGCYIAPYISRGVSGTLKMVFRCTPWCY